MTGLSDAAVTRLKRVGHWPELASDRYTLVEEIGRGGMGTVYLAIDEALGREVAIKVPHVGIGAEAAQVASSERRLQTEARVLAALEHPGIVPIHDTGRLADGRLFYVMKRVKGRTLRAHLADVSDLPERLRVFERVCEPVAFAHAHGCIHRDLKPENVMVGAFGEVMVMDWGAVKVGSLQSSVDSRSAVGSSVDSRQSIDNRQSAVDSQQSTLTNPQSALSVTTAGAVIGTVGFMAPEQARGALEIDQRADVYGLGAILCFLLTGDAPVADADLLGLLRRQGTPRPLAAICARALAADAAARYSTVAALAEDVARFRAGRAVEAYRETIAERVVRFGRTYRTAILLVLAYIVMRTLVAFFARW